MAKVKLKLEVTKYIREIYWKDVEVEIPDGISNADELMDYLQNDEDGGTLYDKLNTADGDDSQIDEKDSDFQILDFEKEEVVK